MLFAAARSLGDKVWAGVGLRLRGMSLKYIVNIPIRRFLATVFMAIRQGCAFGYPQESLRRCPIVAIHRSFWLSRRRELAAEGNWFEFETVPSENIV
jgi:hypothetical protein